jgi:DNA polymerase-4
MEKAFLHIDLDSFFVSVERLHNPGLVGKPVIVGGSSSRGVVAACSYEARHFGIHSAMPITLARKLCPHGYFLSGDMHAYDDMSKTVTTIIENKAPMFEKSSIDEFYLDISGMDKFFGTQKWAWELRDKIKKETKLPLSMGLSVNKTVSKIATGEAKPDGKIYIAGHVVKDFLKPLDIRKMPMVGEVTHKFFLSMGIYTIGMLMEFPCEVLQQLMGKNGISLWKRANGIDTTPVVPYHENKSISTEQTLHEDTTDVKYLRSLLTAMVESLSHKLRNDGKMAATVSVKVRYSDFQSESRQMRISFTNREDILLESVLSLFEKCYNRRLLVRLVGIRFTDLVYGNYQLQLFDKSQQKVGLDTALDKIRNRYGLHSVGRANGLLNSRIKNI